MRYVPLLTAGQLQEYRDRQIGVAVPQGYTDDRGIWRPSVEEHAACCEAIVIRGYLDRSRLFRHCKTAKHIYTRDQERNLY